MVGGGRVGLAAMEEARMWSRAKRRRLFGSEEAHSGDIKIVTAEIKIRREVKFKKNKNKRCIELIGDDSK